ncbi:MAG: hypothetical protein BGO30_07620 [Bacteroidetes bacterium 41-46]|nr:MAG: hypothetical protein BGO30_07620 [Bacteroidetes bacterium 41-46]
MAKASIVILEKNRRADGSYPVQIRIFNNGKHAYMDTEISANNWELTIQKDSSVLGISDRRLYRRADDYLKKVEDAMNTLALDSLSAREVREAVMLEIRKNKRSATGINLIDFLEMRISELKAKGKTGMSANAKTLKNSLIKFIERPILFSNEIRPRFLKKYQEYLELQGLNETSQYNMLKELRTTFNAAIEEYNKEDDGDIVIKNYPFRKYKLKQPLTDHRGLYAEDIIPLYRQYDNYDSLSGRERLALDVYFLSFFLIGINSVDLYYLTSNSIKSGRLVYNRKKVKDRREDKGRTSILIEPEAMVIMKKYLADKSSSMLLRFSNRYRTPGNFNHAISTGLKGLCEKAGINRITYYSARHSWATIARNKCEVDKDDINLALNHIEQNRAMRTTDIYIRPSYTRVDHANRKVINHFFSELQSSLEKASPPPLSEATVPQSPEEKQ